MMQAKGRKAVNKIDQQQADLPPSREQKHGHHHATNHDEAEYPFEDTALSTVAYTVGIGLVLYLAYVLVMYGYRSLF